MRIVAMLLLCLAATGQSAELRITMVGNAGVLLTDGATSLLVDLPYESGAFGYMTYRISEVEPRGDVVSVVTHHHRDHFAPELFTEQPGWRVLGPTSALEGVPDGRVIHGDSVVVGAFHVVAIPTPHTDDHRSYRVRWGGHVLHFVGDTEDPSSLATGPPIDLLFITPWLSCAASDAAMGPLARRSVAYHLQPRGNDRICGDVEVLEQGASFELPAR